MPITDVMGRNKTIRVPTHIICRR